MLVATQRYMSRWYVRLACAGTGLERVRVLRKSVSGSSRASIVAHALGIIGAATVAGTSSGALARDFFDFSPRAYAPRYMEPRAYYAPFDYGRSRGGDSARDPLIKRTAEQLRKSPKPPPVKGPLLIAVSLAHQRLTLYDDGVAIAHSPISSGTASHPTPTGLFSVIQKARWHRSNLYSAAPMPFMQRITWSGVALHSGHLPGYPASHGCIRLPNDFAIRLFRTTQNGARVVVSQREVAPVAISHRNLFRLPTKDDTPVATDDRPVLRPSITTVPATASASGGAASAADPAPDEAESAKPETKVASMTAVGPTSGEGTPDTPLSAEKPLRPGPVSVFVSRKEQRLYVRKGFEPLFDVPVVIHNPDQPIGTHLFLAMNAENGGPSPRWMVVSPPLREPAHLTHSARSHKGKGKGKAAAVEPAPQSAAAASAALDRIEFPSDAVARITELMSVGAALTVSDEGLGPETGKETDFVVLTSPPQPSKRAKPKSPRYEADRFDTWRPSRSRWF